MLEEKITKIGEKWDSIPEEKQEDIGKRILRGLNAVVGVGAGTIDAVTTGVPYLSVGLPVYDALVRISAIPQAKSLGIDPWMFVDDKKEFVKEVGKNRLAYALGATIPFAVKYHNEIINFVYQVADRLL